MTFDHARWLEIAKTAAEAARVAVAAIPPEQRGELARRPDGEQTLAIDMAADDAILEVIRASGLPCTIVTEERGDVDLGAPLPRILIDPVDGSRNASRGPAPHAVSIAVADGPSMADVQVGHVLDLAGGQSWWAIRGAGAYLDGRRLPTPPERRTSDGRLELLAVEAADPHLLTPAMPILTEEVWRLRCSGAIAISLCHLAAGAVDAMMTLWWCRPVDAAAAQLLVTETGGAVRWSADATLSDVPLDCNARSPIIAARSESSLDALRPAVDHLVPASGP
jgi:myo-inositol-1(or 4)-monophosphatase